MQTIVYPKCRMIEEYSKRFVDALAQEVDSINRRSSNVLAELQTDPKPPSKGGELAVQWWRVSLTSTDPVCPFSASIGEWFKSLDYVLLDLFLPDDVMWSQFAVAIPTATPNESGILNTVIETIEAVLKGVLGIATCDDNVTAALCLRQQGVYSFYPLGDYSQDGIVKTSYFINSLDSNASIAPPLGVLDDSSRNLRSVPSAELRLSSSAREVELGQPVRLPGESGILLCDISSQVG
ncbi:hypothetical protein QE410_003247 [Microbacterium sp. SORGH_AS 1204]|uniref:hypothetical protein n=1 Tax=Microbacterium sp. SORGH_AS_1204 TaxID=3041785 RepID=UPI0027945D60|nr:hypothetical protein [Microbacterium sp. SORGH_AS_1204]MDQ1138448.1 hypothetical protein [Microbacterium sp. SORGH_AS_1204]